LATTLGETGGDTVTMTLNRGYLAGSALFGVALVVLVAAQILAKRLHPVLYWATIVSAAIGAIIIAGLIVLSQRPGQHPGPAEGSTAAA
jgi:uncharacterized membrane-anchored protein